MGHDTIYHRKNLIKGALREYIKPYLLRGLKIERANQVWCTDITYIPMAKGFMYMTLNFGPTTGEYYTLGANC